MCENPRKHLTLIYAESLEEKKYGLRQHVFNLHVSLYDPNPLKKVSVVVLDFGNKKNKFDLTFKHMVGDKFNACKDEIWRFSIILDYAITTKPLTKFYLETRDKSTDDLIATSGSPEHPFYIQTGAGSNIYIPELAVFNLSETRNWFIEDSDFVVNACARNIGSTNHMSIVYTLDDWKTVFREDMKRLDKYPGYNDTQLPNTYDMNIWQKFIKVPSTDIDVKYYLEFFVDDNVMYCNNLNFFVYSNTYKRLKK
jgi:hypothetical protein